MRHITEAGLQLICRFEGFSPKLYRCEGGYDTIGYGHLVQPNEDFSSGIDEATARTLLMLDVKQSQWAVLRQIQVPLTDGQYDALVSFTYNLGEGALQRSSLRRKVNREDHTDVPKEFRRWVWAGGRKLRGLMKRREAEIERYNS